MHVRSHFQPLPTKLAFAYFDRGSYIFGIFQDKVNILYNTIIYHNAYLKSTSTHTHTSQDLVFCKVSLGYVSVSQFPLPKLPPLLTKAFAHLLALLKAVRHRHATIRTSKAFLKALCWNVSRTHSRFRCVHFHFLNLTIYQKVPTYITIISTSKSGILLLDEGI